jgi:hypothetical protein
MFRTLAALILVGLLTLAVMADEKFTYDTKVTHVQMDPVKKTEVGRKDGVDARADGNPAKDAEVVWHVRASTFKTLPKAGDLFLDNKGRAWAIRTVKEVPGGEQYVCACRKLPQPPVPPSE